MAANNSKCEEALDYWRTGIQYLHLAECVARETAKQGNTFLVFSDEPISLEQLEQETKWGDHKLVLPLLFCFYHGLELLLKGFLAARGQPFSSNHQLSNLLRSFDSCFPKRDFGLIARRYIAQNQLPPLLKSFCRTSGITIDDYYQALKYPESSKRGKVYRHAHLMYQGKSGLSLFEALIADIPQARKDAVELGRSICPSI